MTLCAAVDLKAALVPEDRPIPRPRQYHARTEHRLPRAANQMQTELDSLCSYTDSHLMAISKSKTKTMLCNTRIKWDFIPELKLDNDDIEVVQQMKIVGFIMRSDMRTCSNTEYLVKKAYKRMWLVRRLKGLGASRSQLIDALQKQVFSVLWLGAPAWFGQLTEQERKDIDRVAKVGLRIIFGEFYCGFDNTLRAANIRKPTEQLARMTDRFAAKTSRSSKFSKWFQPTAKKTINTRSIENSRTYKNVPARTARYGQSPIPYLTNIINAL